MLGENGPVAAPTTEDSSMHLNEPSNTPGENAVPVQPESSVEAQPSAESHQTRHLLLLGMRGLGRGILL